MARKKKADTSSKTEKDTPTDLDAADAVQETDSEDPISTEAVEDAVEEMDAVLEDEVSVEAEAPDTEDTAEELEGAEVSTDELDREDLPEGSTDEIDPASDVSIDTEAEQEVEDVVETAEDSIDTAAKDDVVELSEPESELSEAESDSADHISEEEAEQLIEEAETVEPSSVDPEPVEPPAPEVIKETIVEHKAGFAPTLVGGVLAAAIGYLGAAYASQNVWPFQADVEEDGFRTEIQSTLDAQSGALTEVTDRLSVLESVEPPTIDLSPLETGLAGVQDTASAITARLDELAGRLEALERAPVEQAVSPEAIASYENALARLEEEINAQRVEVEQMVAGAMEAEGNAAAIAQVAAARAALADLTAALDTGGDYTAAVSALMESGVDVPEALSAHSGTGIPTAASLIEAFPEAARAALSSARTEATDGSQGSNRVATFFANQLGARSVAPRDGDDPDAILSRAEAAVRSGDISAALTEISMLPEVAQSAISAWQSSATTRLEAKSAADALVQQLLQE